jgi:hypothetical protein
VRCAGGEFEAAEGAISTYDGLSWGAGDGAIAMAVLMMLEGARELGVQTGSLEIYFATSCLPILVLCLFRRNIGFVRLMYSLFLLNERPGATKSE